MESLWNDQDAARYLERYAPRWGEALALRVYTSHLIGKNPFLVMHGGGNTSVKGRLKTLVGDDVEALFVKGSGWELDSIEPPGFPAVDLAYLRRLRGLPSLSDEEMINQFRTHLFDASAPNPSVEALLHAFLPHTFIDHTHADVALVVTNQPAGEALAAEVFGPRWGVVPYVMPGLKLAQVVADVVDRRPDLEGIVLLNHGLVSFGDDARTSYERMIHAVDRAERFVAGKIGPRPAAAASSARAPERSASEVAPTLRGALSERSQLTAGGQQQGMRVLAFRTGEAILRALARPDARALAASNPLTPDHVIRTKGPALFLEGLDGAEEGDALRERLRAEVAAYHARYQRYFDENSRPGLVRLDPSPRVVLAPGVGLFTTGPTMAEAQVAADIVEHTLEAKAQANDLGRYAALSDADLFAMEYWSLEQAKLGKAAAPALGGQVALVTGAAGAIGAAICKKLLDAGAQVIAADRDQARLDALVGELDRGRKGRATALVLDVTDEQATRHAFERVRRLHGGLDVLVLNAGIAHVSRIEGLSLEDFRRVLDVNLFGYFLALREATPIFRAQGCGGNVVVNSSKNVFAPGAEFGAYSASKAAGHQLAKVAALELAPLGVRVNLINADGIFGDEKTPSGLWQEVGPGRARARGLSLQELPEFYRKRNLLQARVTAEHVANAALFFASNQTPTTGATLPVDGGIPEAFPR